MLAVDLNDLLSMDEFDLRWRWTDSKWNLLPPNALASIRPLKRQKANELNAILENLLKPILLRITGQTDTQLRSGADKHAIESFDTSGDPSEGHEWLCKVLPSRDGDAFVSWQDDMAAVVRLTTFIEYWDDFCYPLSHDVVVVPTSANWILYYWNEETLYFWKR